MHRIAVRLATVLAALAFVLPIGSPAVAQAPYRILLTNDDGVRAPGIAAMAQALSGLGEVTIIAPSDNHSGTGHAITLSDPIYVERAEVAGKSAIGLSGSPATCVRVAVASLMPQRPDLVVSGVNRGLNWGLNGYISGTVGAAREAAMQGIPAIATSLDISGHPNYGPSAAATAKVVEIIKQGGLPKGVFLNINAPAGTELKGLKWTTQSNQMGIERFDEARTPYGRRLFWSFFQQPTAGEPGTDIHAVLDGYVAVTPLKASEFDDKAYESLKGRFGGDGKW